MILDELISLNAKNPIQRYHFFEQSYGENVLAEMIIITLYCIDETLRKMSQINYSFYVQDDISIQNLLRLALNKTYKNPALISSMVLIDTSKLIYRFNCAKKFKVLDVNTCHYRINSWGKEFIRQIALIAKYQQEYD